MAAGRQVLVGTGTGTGVGKTGLAALLVRRCVQTGRPVRAFKPLCSGGREDAKALAAASGGAQTLDEINPWHFEAPLSPALAARLERQTVSLMPVGLHIGRPFTRRRLTLVQRGGGALRPLPPARPAPSRGRGPG